MQHDHPVVAKLRGKSDAWLSSRLNVLSARLSPRQVKRVTAANKLKYKEEVLLIMAEINSRRGL